MDGFIDALRVAARGVADLVLMLLSAGFLAESGRFPSLRNESEDPPEVPVAFRPLDCPRALPIGFVESIASLSTLGLALPDFSDAWKLLVDLTGGFAGGMCCSTLSDHFGTQSTRLTVTAKQGGSVVAPNTRTGSTAGSSVVLGFGSQVQCRN